jgi:hypothetical protein
MVPMIYYAIIHHLNLSTTYLLRASFPSVCYVASVALPILLMHIRRRAPVSYDRSSLRDYVPPMVPCRVPNGIFCPRILSVDMSAPVLLVITGELPSPWPKRNVIKTSHRPEVLRKEQRRSVGPTADDPEQFGYEIVPVYVEAVLVVVGSVITKGTALDKSLRCDRAHASPNCMTAHTAITTIYLVIEFVLVWPESHTLLAEISYLLGMH